MSVQPLRPAILFDLDGTLVDSVDGLCMAIRHAMEHIEHPVPSRDRLISYIGEGAPRLIHRAITDDLDGVADNDTFASAYEKFADAYLRCCGDGTVLRLHAREILEWLHSEKYPIAVVTNKPSKPTRRVIEHLGVSDFIGVMVSPDTVGERKPNPTQLHHALDVLEVSSGIMVGDSICDLLAAQAAGMPFIAIRGGYNRNRDIGDEKPTPCVVIDELEDLPMAISIAERLI